jgi:phosphonopyruvate decarboxylase
MVEPKAFVERLAGLGIDFFTGVPDSLLKDLCAYITEHCPAKNHVIAANEGGAVALATGYHLAGGKAGLVYMQNSGTGNAINPLLSLADPEVYSIPMLVVIGWRGEPGIHDEPQHVKQGKAQEAILKSLGYRYEIMSPDPNTAFAQLDSLVADMRSLSSPVVLLVRKGDFAPYAMGAAGAQRYAMSREEAIKAVLASLGDDDRVVSTTGMASREIYELRDARGEGHGKDFLTVGSMGHAIMIAMGLASFSTHGVYCLDGDGAAIMHLGSLALAAKSAPSNLKHIILNNGAHDSVGGQPTIGYALDFAALAKTLGYQAAFYADTLAGLSAVLEDFRAAKGPCLLEIRVRGGARKDLGRPKTSPVENKSSFMAGL